MTSSEFGTEYISDRPLVKVQFVVGTKKITTMPIVDTGCDAEIVLTKRMAELIGLNEGNRISETQEITLADGSVIAFYLHTCEIILENKTREVAVAVLHTDEILGKKIKHSKPLLGRGIIDAYNVTFQGKARPKKVIFNN